MESYQRNFIFADNYSKTVNTIIKSGPPTNNYDNIFRKPNLYYPLLKNSNENINIPPAEFESELTFPSNDFQKIIRDMINIGENIDIKCIGPKLVLNCTAMPSMYLPSYRTKNKIYTFFS